MSEQRTALVLGGGGITGIAWEVGLLASQSLSGDLRRGWGLFGTASYKRLVGDFKRSPIVADRGSATQWFVSAGVGYSW